MCYEEAEQQSKSVDLEILLDTCAALERDL